MLRGRLLAESLRVGADLRCRRGDRAGRAEAVAHGRAAGTPEHQLHRVD